MKTRLLFIITILLLPTFFACRNNIRLSASKTFDNAVWGRFDFLHFDFQIDQPEREYEVLATVRYTEAFEDEKLPVVVAMVLPSGEERVKRHVLELRDKANKPLGVSEDGHFVLTTSLHEGLTINEAGKMKIEIENHRSKAYTQGIVAFGIILESR
jgi:gliding motility-associated lipoprotein GldH